MSDGHAPRRIQRRRTKGWRMPPNTIYVGRQTKWGNPYRVGTQIVDLQGLDPDHTLPPMNDASAVESYRLMLPFRDDLDIKELRGQNLACWCPLDKPCHADVLLEIANREIR